jgi:CheY-like chemotaxis protein/HPt (histidine-containing phosphotransfer) domain-containing protein
MNPTSVDGARPAITVMQGACSAGHPFPLILLDAMMPDMDGFALAERIKQNPEWAGATIMMLSSAGQRGDATRCRQLGIAAYLTKPVRASELLDAVMTALGRGGPAAESPSLITRHSLREHRAEARVLLAEDNPVNQKVAVRALERQGCSVVVATNGQEALDILDAADAGEFQAVLMDLQMPVMGGLEATAAIREREETTGTHIPIIAMTAHAMKGDRERCLEAGMDDYLSKPLDPARLDQVLTQWVRPGPASDDSPGLDPMQPPPEVAEPERPAPGAASPLQMEKALEQMGGDQELFTEVLGLFLGTVPSLVAEIRSGLSTRDAERIKAAAHTLKGSASNVCAEPARRTAEILEGLGRDKQFDQMEQVLDELSRHLDRLDEFARTL